MTLGELPSRMGFLKVEMIRNANNLFSILIVKAWDWMYISLRQFLNEYDVESEMSFKNSIDYEVVLVNILRKDVNLFQNHAWMLLIAK